VISFDLYNRKTITFLFLLVTSLTIYLYWQTSSGSLLLDDFTNLGNLGNINNPNSFLQFILSGFSGPTGRPVSLLSFAVFSSSWPNELQKLIQINILIHSFNATLVFIFLHKLLKLTSYKHQNYLIAGIIASVWMILPNHVSSVAYIIQRMTLLSTFFSLLSLIHFSSYLEQIKQKPHLINKNIIFSIIFLTLGVLSKENAATTVIIIFFMTFLVPAENQVTILKKIKLLFGMPSLLIIIYLFYIALNPNSYNYRDFSLVERVLTQSNLWVSHVSHFLIPRPATNGVFYDNLTVVSTTSEYTSAIFIIILSIVFNVYCLIRLIKKQCLFSFFCLFVFSSHLIESTVLPLELYFEHRNYFPYIGASALLVLLVVNKYTKYKLSILLFSSLFILGNIYSLNERTKLWGEPLKAATYWAEGNPKSYRAQDNAAVQFSMSRNYFHSYYFLKRAFDANKSPITWIRARNMACQTKIPFPLKSLIIDDFKKMVFNPSNYNIMKEAITLEERGQCQYNEIELLLAVNAIMENPFYRKRKHSLQQYTHLKALIYLHRNDIGTATKLFKKSLYIWPTIEQLIAQTSILAKYGYCKLAFSYLNEHRHTQFNFTISQQLKNLLFSSEEKIMNMIASVKNKCLNTLD